MPTRPSKQPVTGPNPAWCPSSYAFNVGSSAGISTLSIPVRVSPGIGLRDDAKLADSLRSRRVIRIDSQSALCPPERLGIVMELLLSYRHLTV